MYSTRHGQCDQELFSHVNLIFFPSFVMGAGYIWAGEETYKRGLLSWEFYGTVNSL